MPCLDKDVTFKVFFDIILLAGLGAISLSLALVAWPFTRGFYCDDQTISYPYRDNTVSTLVLVLVSVGGTTLSIIGCEIYLYVLNSRKGYRLSEKYCRSKQTCFRRFRVHGLASCVYQSLVAYAFGVVVTQAATDILKYTLGRLRPHFLDVCQPNWNTLNCTGPLGIMRYVTEDMCSTVNSHLLKDARLSHPSGHASLSFYSFVFLTLYTQARMRWRGSRLLRHFLQVVVLYAAIFISASRVSDYKHHWSDVLGGAVLGTVVAVMVAYFVADLYDMGPLCGPVKQYTAELLSGDEDADPGNGHIASWSVTDASRHNRASSQNTE